MKYEYKIIELPLESKNLGLSKGVNSEAHVRLLNDHGTEGWELVSVTSFDDASFGTVKLLAYFRRSVSQ